MQIEEEEEETSLQEGVRSIQLRTFIKRPPAPTSLPLTKLTTGTPGDPSPDPLLPPPPPLQSDIHEDTDEEVLNALGGHLNLNLNSMIRFSKPSKTQVLFYLGGALNFRLKRVGTDLQITDADDFPLFDVWLDMDCCRCTWVVEAYGKVVLLMHEEAASASAQCCSPARRSILVTDWNGDVFGYLQPGDPFLLQTAEKQTVAKLVPHGLGGGVAVGVGGNTESATSSTRSLPVGEKRLCWLCVLEGSGRHIARLEDFDFIQYNKDVAFQLKLLTLAGIIRLSSPWMMPGRGESRHMMSSCWGFVSAMLNCCAYCFY